MSERLTKRDEYGNADIIGVDSAELQLNLEFDELNRVTDALNRLAAYEDTGLTPERIRELQNAFNILFESERQKQQEIDRLKEKLNEVLQDFYQYVQGGKEICAFCLYDDECEPGETICGTTYKGFKWRGLNEKEEL